MLDRAGVLRATAANHRAWFRRCAALAGGGVERCDGLDIVVAGGAGTIAFPRTRSRSRIDAAMRRARDLRLRSMSAWALGPDRVLGTLLLARGFEQGWEPHWMALDLERVPAGEPEHHVVRAAVGMGAKLPYGRPGPYPAAARHLAVIADGQAVGHVVMHPWRGVAGIYDMGVASAHRRQGFGRALTLAACRLARELGCTHATLNATPDGERLYRTVGFESIGHGRTWWLHPGRRPTARQTELVEAIGLGGPDVLAALDPTDAELEQAVPGPGPPLAVAVVTGQASVADWILRRRPDLVSAAVEPRGGTLLHVAVECDDEALVRVALAHGADRSARDHQWNATPLDWADYLGRAALAALLRP